MQFDPSDEVWSPKQVAQFLGLTVSWVYEATRGRTQLRSVHPVPFKRVGKYLRFSKKAVQDWFYKLGKEKEWVSTNLNRREQTK